VVWDEEKNIMKEDVSSGERVPEAIKHEAVDHIPLGQGVPGTIIGDTRG
jgi:hypothetical protein